MKVEIRASDCALDARDHERVRRRVDFGIARFGGELRRLTVTVHHLGESRWLCTVVLRPRRTDMLLVEGCDKTLHQAAGRALARAEREYRRMRRTASRSTMRDHGLRRRA